MEHNRSPQEGGGVDGVGGAGLNSLSVRGRGSEGTLSNKRCQVKPTLLMKCVSPAGLRRSANRERNTHREKPHGHAGCAVKGKSGNAYHRSCKQKKTFTVKKDRAVHCMQPNFWL